MGRCSGMRVVAISLSLLAACSHKAREPSVAPVLVGSQVGPIGCPAASSVRMVKYTAEHGWVLLLGSELVDSDGNAAHDDRPLSKTERAAMVPVEPTWILQPDEPPCATTYGDAYATLVTDGMANESYRVELRGCAAPADAKSEPLALASLGAVTPDGCTVGLEGLVSSHTDYTKPATDTVPAELAAALGPACQAPCTRLWRITQAESDTTPVAWEAQVSELTVGAPDDECSWPADNASTVFVRIGDTPRSLWSLVPQKTVDPALAGLPETAAHLFGVLAEGTRVRAVVVTGLGEFSVYGIEGERAHLAKAVTWYIPHEEDTASDGVLGPYCGP